MGNALPLTPRGRRDFCHKYHKQCLCKIISTRVKFHFHKTFGTVYVCIILDLGNIKSCKPIIRY